MKKINIILLLLIIQCVPLRLYSQTWNTDFGVDSLWNFSGGLVCIYSLYNQGEYLYIGGGFENVGTLQVNGIARWDSINWFPLSEGLTSGAGAVRCLGSFNNELYMGGGFWEVDYQPNTKYLAIWDGINWHGASIGEPNTSVYDFKIFDNKLFISGNFSVLGITNFDKIVAYDGTNWLNVGSMGMWVRALEVFNGELYAGGYFGLRKYLGGTTWEDVPGEPNGWVHAMKTDTFNNFLYIGGGGFTTVGDTITSYNVAMWDGFKWNSMGAEILCSVYTQAMAIYRGDLYVGGCMDTLNNGLVVNYITRWDGTKWDSLGCGTNGTTVHALEVYKDELYVGGCFTEAGGYTAYGIARWYVPDTGCNYIKPRVYILADTFYLSGGSVDVQFYNNNAYVDSWQWDFGDTGTDSIQNPIHTYTDTGIYNVTVTVTHDSCVKTAQKTITVLNSTGMINFKPETLNFKLYPNPAEDSFTVEVNIPENINSVIKIYGLKGELLKKYKLNKGNNRTLVHTSGWEKGIYICNLIIDGKVMKSEKMVME